MDRVVEQVEVFYHAIAQLNPTPVVWVAFSGGMDSTVLLHALQGSKPASLELKALHVNHGLQAVSAHWVEHCRVVCRHLTIELRVVDVDIQSASNIEEQARKARYQAFCQVLDDHDVICTAHHQRDQAETLMFNLMRGSGVAGLAAMPQQRPLCLDLSCSNSSTSSSQSLLYRPLLNVPYAVLKDYAEHHLRELGWVEDASNQDTAFRRNYLRHQVLPRFSVYWPDAEAKIACTAQHLQEAQSLLTDLARADLECLDHSEERLNWRDLQALSWPRQKNVLHYWFRHYHQLALDQAGLNWIRDECMAAASDAQPQRNLKSGQIRRFQSYIYYLPPSALETDFSTRRITSLEDLSKLGFDYYLQFGAGVAQHWFESQHLVEIQTLSHKKRPQGRSLKKWFQTHSIPPWQRKNWPILTINNQLVAIIDYKVMPEFTPKATEQGIVVQLARHHKHA